MLRKIHARFAQDCNRQPSDARWLLMEHKHYQAKTLTLGGMTYRVAVFPPPHYNKQGKALHA